MLYKQLLLVFEKSKFALLCEHNCTSYLSVQYSFWILLKNQCYDLNHSSDFKESFEVENLS